MPDDPILQADLDHLWHGSLQHHSLAQQPPFRVEGADGCYIWDADTGRRYLDAMAGLWCVNIGYNRKAVADAIYAQMQRLSFYPLTQSHSPAAALAKRVADLLPSTLNRVFFSNSGSEAVETALKMARQAARRIHPGQNRYKIIARHRAYHGLTFGGLSAGGNHLRKQAFEPLVPGFLHVAPPDELRCAFCHRSCTLACAEEFDRMIRMEGPETVAAVIVEPAIGGGGVFPSPAGYLESLRRICDRHGVLLIFDEVITGFGRTGKLFGFEHSAAIPDILVLAKGLTSGYQPLGATVATEPVWSAFLSDHDPNAKFVSLSTFGGHPAACAASLANLDILLGEQLSENAAHVGSALAERLCAIRDPRIGSIRALGLLIGIELVQPGTIEPLPESEALAIQKRIRQQNVIVGRTADTVAGLGNILTIAPPLILTLEQAATIASAVESALAQ
jgi:adenosylmethionine-8-amino-7-oxononanoate aminotransferase